MTDRDILDPKTEAPLQVGGQRQRFVRRGGPVQRPFVPDALLPLVGLGLVLLLGAAPVAFGIESSAERAAQRALDHAGIRWASATADGQWVELSGRPPSTTDAGEAIDAVKRARLGWLNPVTRVTAKWDGAATPAVVREVTPEARAACDQSLAAALGTARIEFDSASARVGPGSSELLDRVTQAALACPGVLRIEGHTDDEGRDITNVQLSLQRAAAVRTALIERGVPAERLEVEGFGSTKPLASNDTEEGRERNRRIEIRVAPPT